MKKLIIIPFLLVSLSVIGQNDDKVLKATTEVAYLQENDFEKAKILYAEMVKTQVFLNYFNALIEFNKNLDGIHFDPTATKDETWDEWISKHLHKTKFKTLEEAKTAYENLEKKSDAQSRQNNDVYSLLKKASIDQKIEIMQPFFNLQTENSKKPPKP